MTTHILKHTCVTQMSLHGIDIDVISEYIGTDPKTLMDFYRGGGREKIRSQILDLPRKQETWKHAHVGNGHVRNVFRTRL